MNVKNSLAIAISLGITLSGCVNSGTRVTEQQAQQFQKGVSTREQVIAALGQPNSTTLLNDGSRIDVYVHVHAAANAASYIPVVGIFAGGATGTSESATFTYGKDGILSAMSTNSTRTQVKNGL